LRRLDWGSGRAEGLAVLYVGNGRSARAANTIYIRQKKKKSTEKNTSPTNQYLQC
jgi:5,10-methylene-tetrahydrofolate dehydrogenase/methenyl tetrahydrofolate cyclohydrolase